MPSPVAVSPVVPQWIAALLGRGHPAAQPALAQLVTALLSAQRLTATALMRALLSDPTVPARQRQKRVARALARPWLTPAVLPPRLVRAALALVPDPTPHLALASGRLGRWEVFTLGVVWHGRVLLVGWAVLPYPLPKGAFPPTVCALLAQVAAAWPADHAAPHRVADRGFPRTRFVATRGRLGGEFTVRRRATAVVTLGGQRQVVKESIAPATAGTGTSQPATYGSGRQAAAGRLVVGRGLPVLAWHQRDDGSAQVRARLPVRRAQHVATTRGRGVRRDAPTADRGVVLFPTQPTWRAAVQSSRRRWATEGSDRDAQTGWEGQSGWDLGGAVARLADTEAVARVVGLWAGAAAAELARRPGRPERRPDRAGGRPRVEHHRPAERVGARPPHPHRPQRAPPPLALADPRCGGGAPRRPATPARPRPALRCAPAPSRAQGGVT